MRIGMETGIQIIDSGNPFWELATGCMLELLYMESRKLFLAQGNGILTREGFMGRPMSIVALPPTTMVEVMRRRLFFAPVQLNQQPAPRRAGTSAIRVVTD